VGQADYRSLTRVFDMESVVAAHRATSSADEGDHDPPALSSRGRRITITISVDAATQPSDTRAALFTLHSDFFERLAKNERRQYVVAIIPLRRYDGQALGYMWRKTLSRSGDVERMYSLSDARQQVLVEASMGAG